MKTIINYCVQSVRVCALVSLLCGLIPGMLLGQHYTQEEAVGILENYGRGTYTRHDFPDPTGGTAGFLEILEIPPITVESDGRSIVTEKGLYEVWLTEVTKPHQFSLESSRMFQPETNVPLSSDDVKAAKPRVNEDKTLKVMRAALGSFDSFLGGVLGSKATQRAREKARACAQDADQYIKLRDAYSNNFTSFSKYYKDLTDSVSPDRLPELYACCRAGQYSV